MPADPTPSGEQDQAQDTISFHYIKSDDFRVVYAEGAHGGPTPRGLLQMSFWSERAPIPRVTVHELQKGRLGPEVRTLRESREGIVRDISVSVLLTPEHARSVRDWLTRHIEQIEALADASDAPPEEEENGGIRE